MPVRHVHHMVTHETDARILLNRNMAHADFLLSPSTQDRILADFAEVGGLKVLLQLIDGAECSP